MMFPKLIQMAYRRDKLEAEVERLTEKLTSLQEAYLKSAERDKSLTQALFDSKAEVEFWKSKAYEAEQSEGKIEMEVDKLKELVKWYEARHSTIIST